jgi:hypothetical protein
MTSIDQGTLRRRWRTPLIFFQVYLGITVWLFYYGPWPWSIDNGTLLFLFLAASQVAIAIGYRLSWRRVVELQADGPGHAERDTAQALQFLKRVMWITLALAIPSSLSRTGTVIPNVVAGLRDIGLAYNENNDRLDAGNGWVVAEYLRIGFGPWLTSLFPLTVVYWGRMTAKMRLAALALIGFNLSMYIATGVNKGFADIILTLPWLLFVAIATGLLRIRNFKLKATVGSIVLFGAFFMYFTTGQTQRQGSGTEYGTFFTGVVTLQADSNNFISSKLPEDVRVGYEALSRYVVHGYYALSMGFQTDTPSTLGLGNSIFLARNADAVFSTHYFEDQSIPGALDRDFGWGKLLLWHSIYPWLASDFGFPGTLVVMGLLGYLFGVSWGACLARPRPVSVLMLYLSIIVFFYIPANNQVLQSGEGCSSFLIGLLWLLRMQKSDDRQARPSAAPVPALGADAPVAGAR